MAAGQHEMEVPLLKFPDPHIGPLFATETLLMPLVTGWTPRRFVEMAVCVTTGPQVGDTEEDARVYPMTPRNTESYPLKKALPGLAGALGSIIGVWSVQLIRAYRVDVGGVVLLQ